MDRLIQTSSGEHGAWEAAWSKHAAEIDRRIVSFMRHTENLSPDALAILTSEISEWLDTRQIGGDAWVEWRRMRRKPRLVQARVEQRIAHLVADGSISLNGIRALWHY